MTASEARTNSRKRNIVVAILSAYLCVVATAQAQIELPSSMAPLELTPDERAWIEQNPTIRFTGDPDWLPFEAFDTTGNYSGIVSDLLTLIELQTGLNIERVKPDSWSHALKLARDGDVTMISGDTADATLNNDFTPTRSYLSSNIVIVMHEDHPPVNHLEQISDRKIAIVRDYGYTKDLKQQYPSIKFIEVDTVSDGLESVSDKSIDAVLVSNVIATYHITHHDTHAINIVGQTTVFMNASIFVASSQPILNRIVEQALFNIPVRTRNDILHKWIDSDHMISTATSPLSISAQERRWLNEHPQLRLTGDPDWLPYEAFDRNGNYIGIVAEHVQLIEQLLGTEFDIVQTDSWSQSVALARGGQVDVISESTDSKLNGPLKFTDPYLTSRIAMVMRTDNNYASRLSDVAEKRIGMVQDYGYADKIRNAYPNIQFAETPTLHAGLEKVSTGQLDVMLCSLPQCTYQITSASLSNIRVIGPTEFNVELALGVQPEFAPLLPILNRAIATISESQRQQILESWIEDPLLDSRGTRYVKLLAWFAGLLLATFIIRNTWLRLRLWREQKTAAVLDLERRRAVDANHAKTEFLAAIGHEIHTPMNGVIGMLDNLVHTPLTESQQQTVEVVRDSAGAMLTVVDDMLDFSRLEIGQLKIKTSAVRLDHLIESVVNIHSITAVKKSLPIKLFIDPELRGSIEIDSLRVRQILSNLLGNAIKYTQKGAIELSATAVVRDEQELTFRLKVKDSGIGIASEDQSLLFDSFVQVGDKAGEILGGAGLGLRICKKLADKLRGELKLSSELNVGTTATYQQSAPCSDNEPLVSDVMDRRARILCRDITLVKTIGAYLDELGVKYIHTPISADIASLSNIENDGFDADFLIVDHHSVKESDTLVSSNGADSANRMIVLDPNLRLDQNKFDQHICSIGAYPLIPSAFRMAIRVVSDQYLPAESKVERPAPANRYRILVVEDHPTNQFVIRGQLDLLGHRTFMVDNGEAGLIAWRRGGFDAIITDVSMPVLDGYKMTSLIRAEQPKNQTPIPIIGLTAATGAQNDDRWQRAGMNECLIKPIHLVTLDKTLQRVLSENAVFGQEHAPPTEADEARLNTALLKRYYVKNDRIKPLLKAFLSNSRRDLDGIQEALAAGNLQTLRNRAHALSGAASVIFAQSLINACRQIAESKADVPRSHLATLVDEIDSAVSTLQQAIERSLTQL